VANLVRFLVNKLKIIEKDRLYETVKVEHEIEGKKVTIEQNVALSARFINKALNLLPTMVSKNWARFDNFLEIIYAFGVGEAEEKTLKEGELQDKVESYPDE